MKILSKSAIVLSILIIVTELVLRFVWGFGTPVLFVYSADYEYIYAPNQEVTRFGNKIMTN